MTDATRCNGNGVETCFADGGWSQAVPCVDQVCAGGACTGACGPGATRCNVDVVQACDEAGAWADAGNPPCEPADAGANCTPGTVVGVDPGACAYARPCDLDGTRTETTTWCGQGGGYLTRITMDDVTCMREADVTWRGESRPTGTCAAVAPDAGICSYEGVQPSEIEACAASGELAWVDGGPASCSLEGTSVSPDFKTCGTGGVCYREMCCTRMTATLDLVGMAALSASVLDGGFLDWQPPFPMPLDGERLVTGNNNVEASGMAYRWASAPVGAVAFRAFTDFTYECFEGTGIPDWVAQQVYDMRHITCPGGGWNETAGDNGCMLDSASMRNVVAPAGACPLIRSESVLGRPTTAAPFYDIAEIAGPDAPGLALVPAEPVDTRGGTYYSRPLLSSLTVYYVDSLTCGLP